MQQTNAIVGAGQAGANAAIAMREAGFDGRILLLGAEPHAPYERPPLSKAALVEDPLPETQYVVAAERYESLGIELRAEAHVVALDAAARTLTLANGEALAFDRLLLATGGRARPLRVPGAERAHVMRTLEDAWRLRPLLVADARVVCIGAGVIGLEVAASARHRGCAVTVLEAAPHAMGRALTRAMARWVERLHEANGVALHFGVAVEDVGPDAVRCADGREFAADVVVAGVGMLRNTELAQAAGLDVDNGIVVDEFGRTGIEGIHAAGDVAAFWHPGLRRRLRLETWKHAQNHGIAVGRAMAGVGEQYDETPWFWTDQHGVNLQVAGAPQDSVETVLRGDEQAASFCAFHLDAAGRMVGATGVNAPREVRAALSLIRAGAAIAPSTLADPATKLQALAKAAG